MTDRFDPLSSVAPVPPPPPPPASKPPKALPPVLAKQIAAIPDPVLAALAGALCTNGLPAFRQAFLNWSAANPKHRHWRNAWPHFLQSLSPAPRLPDSPAPATIPISWSASEFPVPVTAPPAPAWRSRFRRAVQIPL